MMRLGKAGIITLATPGILLAGMVLLWQLASIDLGERPKLLSAINPGLFGDVKGAVQRNPFTYLQRKEATQTVVAESKDSMDVSTPTMAANNPLAQMTYSGSIVKGGVTHAFILAEQEMHVVKVGDFLEGNFRVAKINSDSVSMFKEPEGKAYTLYVSGSTQ